MNAPDTLASATIHTCWGCGQLITAPQWQRTPHKCATTPRDPEPVPEWARDQGACVGRDPELWFAEDDPVAVEVATRICWEECPVRAACLTAANHLNPVGIWGGWTTKERVAAKRRNRDLAWEVRTA